jgi:hypothetical protein
MLLLEVRAASLAFVTRVTSGGVLIEGMDLLDLLLTARTANGDAMTVQEIQVGVVHEHTPQSLLIAYCEG